MGEAVQLAIAHGGGIHNDAENLLRLDDRKASQTGSGRPGELTRE